MAASWKGTINFGLVNIPVELHRVEQRMETRSTMLDKRDLSPVGYKRFNKKTGEDVQWNDIVSGFELDEGQYVVLSDEERQEAHPRSTQEMEIVEFVNVSAIDPVFFERPYYMTPAARAEKPYAALRETLKRTGKAAILQIVLHTKQHLAAITVRGPALTLNLLRYAHEIRDTSGLDLPGEKSQEVKLTPAELSMAEELVQSMSADWKPEKYRNTYRDKLVHLIETKAQEGRVFAVEEAPPVAASEDGKILDLMAALRESVKQQGGAPSRGRPATTAAQRRRRRQRA